MRYRNGDDLYKLCASGLADAAGPPGHDLGFAWGSGERGAARSERIARTRRPAVVGRPSQPPLAPPGVARVPLKRIGDCLDGRDDNQGVAGLEPGERIYDFQGRRYDHSTGLYRFGARNYSPVPGRWMEQDPAGYINGSSLYQADDGSPASMTDPLGTQAAAPAPAAPTTAPTTAPVASSEYTQITQSGASASVFTRAKTFGFTYITAYKISNTSAVCSAVRRFG